MNQEQFTAVDRYLVDLLVKPDDVLQQTLKTSADAGLPPINVSAAQGKLLQLLARAHGARHILEIGTLGGYSTIWLARALPPDGRLVTLEVDPKHVEVALANFARAGLQKVIELIPGRAIDNLPTLQEQNRPPFDLVFIDADKPSTGDYFNWALRLSRVGSVIIVDNVIRKGALIVADSPDPNVQAMRRFTKQLAEEKRITSTVIQTVGSKGYDGFAISLVTST